MALQDLPVFDPKALIDPKTGQPYPFGSPGYQAAELPFLESQLQGAAERAANARGMFYSGPAMADELQTASNLAYQMAQEGARQSESEAVLKEQQAYQQQLEKQQEEAAQRLAQQQGAAGMKAAAIQGGLGSLGTVGTLYMLNGGKLLPGAAKTATDVAGVADMSGVADTVSSTPTFAGDMGGSGVLVGGAPAASSSWLPFLPGGATLPSAGSLAGAGLGSLAAYNIGGGNKGSLPDELGGGLGGLAGLYLGGPLGATAGTFAGRQIGDFLGHLF